MNFLGREKEILVLEKEYARDGGFVVIYGRRRIGKTTLIKQFIKSKTAFYFLATKEVESQSMKRFAGVIARTTGNSVLQKAAFSDWLDLFQAVARLFPVDTSKRMGRNSQGQQCYAHTLRIAYKYDEKTRVIL